MDVVAALLLVLAIVVGAAMQRLTGMGFALVSAPFVVLLLGPTTGIVLVNICGVVASALVLFRVLRDIDWKKFLILAAAAVAGVVPGAAIVKFIPPAWLQIGVGLMVLAGLTVSLRMSSIKHHHGIKPMLLAGVTSGIMNTTAGVGGPAMSVYAVASGWGQRSFAATMQPYFLTIGAASVLAKYVASPESMPLLDSREWAAIGGAIVVGLVAGEVLARWITPAKARALMVVLAYGGAAAATTRGIVLLLA